MFDYTNNDLTAIAESSKALLDAKMNGSSLDATEMVDMIYEHVNSIVEYMDDYDKDILVAEIFSGDNEEVELTEKGILKKVKSALKTGAVGVAGAVAGAGALAGSTLNDASKQVDAARKAGKIIRSTGATTARASQIIAKKGSDLGAQRNSISALLTGLSTYAIPAAVASMGAYAIYKWLTNSTRIIKKLKNKTIPNLKTDVKYANSKESKNKHKAKLAKAMARLEKLVKQSQGAKKLADGKKKIEAQKEK
jgi:hypothetical protein